MGQLTHFDSKGRAKMVDVSRKKVTKREAVASADVIMKPGTMKMSFRFCQSWSAP